MWWMPCAVRGDQSLSHPGSESPPIASDDRTAVTVGHGNGGLESSVRRLAARDPPAWAILRHFGRNLPSKTSRRRGTSSVGEQGLLIG